MISDPLDRPLGSLDDVPPSRSGFTAGCPAAEGGGTEMSNDVDLAEPEADDAPEGDVASKVGAS